MFHSSHVNYNTRRFIVKSSRRFLEKYVPIMITPSRVDKQLKYSSISMRPLHESEIILNSTECIQSEFLKCTQPNIHVEFEDIPWISNVVWVVSVAAVRGCLHNKTRKIFRVSTSILEFTRTNYALKCTKLIDTSILSILHNNYHDMLKCSHTQQCKNIVFTL